MGELEGIYQLAARLQAGSGLRREELVTLRIRKARLWCKIAFVPKGQFIPARDAVLGFGFAFACVLKGRFMRDGFSCGGYRSRAVTVADFVKRVKSGMGLGRPPRMRRPFRTRQFEWFQNPGRCPGLL